MGSGNSTGTARKRATALKAQDARDLLGKALPEVLKIMTNVQIQQMQKVLDAAVINPIVKKEYAEAMRRSVIAQSGGYANRDERLVRKANRIFEQQIPISASDKRIRLDFWPLLTPDAFVPRTNNPDESEFYFDLAAQMEERGVWLCFEPKMVRDPEDLSAWIIDPRNFEVWLSFGIGRYPNKIPTKTGLISQESLKGTNSIGASFYDRVWEGPFLKSLGKAMNELFDAIQEGEQEHFRQARVRDDAAPLVPTISDWLGGAEFSSPKVWEKPFILYRKAADLKSSGDVLGAVGVVVASAVLTEILTIKLEEYKQRTQAGAGRAVGILEVVVIVTAVADIAAPLLKAGAKFFMRRLMKNAATGEARAMAKTAARMRTSDSDLARRADGYMKDMTEWMKKNPDASAADHVAAVERAMRKWKVKEAEWMQVVPGPKGSIAGNRKGGHSSGNAGAGKGQFF